MDAKPLPRLSGKHYKYMQGHFWIIVIRRDNSQLFCRYRDFLFYRLVLWVWNNDRAKAERGKWSLELLEQGTGKEHWRLDENNLPKWLNWLRRTYRRLLAVRRLLRRVIK